MERARSLRLAVTCERRFRNAAKKKNSWPCKQCGDTRSGLQDKNKAVGSEEGGDKKQVVM